MSKPSVGKDSGARERLSRVEEFTWEHPDWASRRDEAHWRFFHRYQLLIFDCAPKQFAKIWPAAVAAVSAAGKKPTAKALEDGMKILRMRIAEARTKMVREYSSVDEMGDRRLKRTYAPQSQRDWLGIDSVLFAQAPRKPGDGIPDIAPEGDLNQLSGVVGLNTSQHSSARLIDEPHRHQRQRTQNTEQQHLHACTLGRAQRL